MEKNSFSGAYYMLGLVQRPHVYHLTKLDKSLKNRHYCYSTTTITITILVYVIQMKKLKVRCR